MFSTLKVKEFSTFSSFSVPFRKVLCLFLFPFSRVKGSVDVIVSLEDGRLERRASCNVLLAQFPVVQQLSQW